MRACSSLTSVDDDASLSFARASSSSLSCKSAVLAEISRSLLSSCAANSDVDEGPVGASSPSSGTLPTAAVTFSMPGVCSAVPGSQILCVQFALCSLTS